MNVQAFPYDYGTITLEILLTRFSNPQNRDMTGQCCDGKKDSISCANSCDVYFVVCDPSRSKCVNSGKILRNGSDFVSSHGNLTSSNGSSSGNFLSISFDTSPAVSGLFFHLLFLTLLKNVCQPSCFALLLFTSYLGNLSYNKKKARKIFLYCIFIKICSNQQVYPYDGRDFVWIQNENLNFSTTKMAAVLISTRNA